MRQESAVTNALGDHSLHPVPGQSVRQLLQPLLTGWAKRGLRTRAGLIRRYGAKCRNEFHNKRKFFSHMAPHGFAFVPRTFLDVESLQLHLRTASQTNKQGNIRYFFKKALESRGTGVFPFHELSEIPQQDLMEEGVFQVRRRPRQIFLNHRAGAPFSHRVDVLTGSSLHQAQLVACPAEALEPYKRHMCPEDDDIARDALPQAG